MYTTVEKFYPIRYQGLWYEVAKSTNEFELGCEGATTNYTMFKAKQNNALFNVTNTCYEARGLERPYSRNIPQRSIRATLALTDCNDPGKLELQISGNKTGDYWIHETDYKSYSIVGSPPNDEHNGLVWLLSRKPVVNINLYRMFIQNIELLGYDSSNIERSKMITFKR